MSQTEQTPEAATAFPPASLPEQPLGEGPLLPECSGNPAGRCSESDKGQATSGNANTSENPEVRGNVMNQTVVSKDATCLSL
jgi:hypothetical protein